MITVHISHIGPVGKRQTFTGYIRIEEEGVQYQSDGEFPAKFNIAQEFAHEFGGHCEEIIIDVSGYNVGTYTF